MKTWRIKFFARAQTRCIVAQRREQRVNSATDGADCGSPVMRGRRNWRVLGGPMRWPRFKRSTNGRRPLPPTTGASATRTGALQRRSKTYRLRQSSANVRERSSWPQPVAPAALSNPCDAQPSVRFKPLAQSACAMRRIPRCHSMMSCVRVLSPARPAWPTLAGPVALSFQFSARRVAPLRAAHYVVVVCLAVATDA